MQKPNDSFDDPLAAVFAVGDKQPSADDALRGALLHAAEELKRTNLDLEQFGYVASHDLQEPLRAVAGFVRLLEHRFPEKLDAKLREYIAGAAEGATRMERLLTDLLTYSRLSTDARAFTPTNLGVPLNAALRNLQFSIQSAKAAVTSDPLPTLSVDESQMLQLFQNLIANALKFRSERPPQELFADMPPMVAREAVEVSTGNHRPWALSCRLRSSSTTYSAPTRRAVRSLSAGLMAS